MQLGGGPVIYALATCTIFKNKRAYRDGIPKKQLNKVGTIPNTFTDCDPYNIFGFLNLFFVNCFYWGGGGGGGGRGGEVWMVVVA